jgi:hypothetical protein
LLDILVLGCWLMVAALLPHSSIPTAYKFALLVLGMTMVILPIVLGKLSRRISVQFQRLEKIARAVTENSTYNTTEILLSTAIWIASAAMLWCITAAMHITLSMDELLFLIAIQLVMQLFPIQGFANSGNHEGGWMAAMMVIGYPADVALKFALASHAVVLVFVLFLGLMAFVLGTCYAR